PLDEFRLSAIKEIMTLDMDLPQLKKSCES
ncbi:MAG: transcriptional regulator, partial [Erysipelotrichia bacterium]|nr:transcriptional regulator [Erysipelotrichia bacterium]